MKIPTQACSKRTQSHLVGLSRCRTAKGEDIWDDLWRQEAHHSTALEGNTLILDQVRKLLDKGLAVGSKELRESLEVRGYADAGRTGRRLGWRRDHPAGMDLADDLADGAK